jgi:hypothetical protein
MIGTLRAYTFSVTASRRRALTEAVESKKPNHFVEELKKTNEAKKAKMLANRRKRGVLTQES